MTDAHDAGSADAGSIGFETAEGVATIELRSPATRNALSVPLTEALLARLAQADADPAVHAVVIAAQGPAFCAGLDLAEALERGMDEGARRLVAVQRALLALGKPVVARVHGAARAGGVGIVACADIAVCAESVTFAFTEARLGVAPLAVSPAVLSVLPRRTAADLWLTGRVMPAREAAEAGLVTTVVPDAELDDAVSGVLAGLRRGVPQGLCESKRILNAPLVSALDAHGDELAARSAALFGSDAARTAMAAFLRPRSGTA